MLIKTKNKEIVFIHDLQDAIDLVEENLSSELAGFLRDKIEGLENEKETAEDSLMNLQSYILDAQSSIENAVSEFN